ncbi:30S ribosomal protein S5 [Patescibacteria group bacterium]|nr:30S ribosomal protein S5 [Patescibacteria group bacterium]MBU1907480.1 30S ribosomal protein S5 [Patescibacteria group bacterium]
MAEEEKTTTEVTTEQAAPEQAPAPAPKRKFVPKKGGAKGRGRGRKRPPREPKEFEQKILDLARVTRVTAGGKRMSFRACLVIGDQKGRVGLGLAKGADVAIAVDKAFRQAKKNIIDVTLIDGTFPHAVNTKFGAAKILLKPAPRGTGLKAGGAMRVVLELAGVPNAVGKTLGSNNKINIAKATFVGLRAMKMPAGIKTDKEKADAKKAKKVPAKKTTNKSK